MFDIIYLHEEQQGLLLREILYQHTLELAELALGRPLDILHKTKSNPVHCMKGN